MKLGHEPEPLTLNTFATETPNNLLRYIIMYELTKGVINKLSISIYIYIYIRAVLTARDARWIAIFMPCYNYQA